MATARGTMTNPTIDRSTPWHLWLIGVLLLLWQGMASFDYVATLIRYEPYLSEFPEDVLEYYFAAPLWMYVMWGIASVGGLIGAILVLMRNKLAVPLFFVALVCGVVAVAYSFGNPPPGSEGSNIFSAAVIAGSAMVLFYLYMMKKNGVLR